MGHLPTATRDELKEPSRARPPTWTRRAVTGATFTSIGVIVTIVVAWGCTLWSHMPQGNLDDMLSFDAESEPDRFKAIANIWGHGRPSHFPDQPELVTEYQPGFGVALTELVAWSGPYPSLDEVESTPEDEIEWPRSYEQRVITAGFPLRSMRVSVWDEFATEGDTIVEFDRVKGGVAFGGSLDDFYLLPLQPLYWELFVGTVFWGGFAFLVVRVVSTLLYRISHRELHPAGRMAVVETA